MNSNTKTVLRWTFRGALIAFSVGFLGSMLIMNVDRPWRWYPIHLFFGVIAGALGGAVGAFAEVVAHTPRRQ